MRVVLGIAGAIVGALVGIVIVRMIVAGNIANKGGWTLILCAFLFVACMVGGSWGGSKITK